MSLNAYEIKDGLQRKANIPCLQFSFQAQCEAQLFELGRTFAQATQNGAVKRLGLAGVPGSGKSVFVKGFLEGLGDATPITLASNNRGTWNSLSRGEIRILDNFSEDYRRIERTHPDLRQGHVPHLEIIEHADLEIDPVDVMIIIDPQNDETRIINIAFPLTENGVDMGVNLESLHYDVT